MRRRFFPVVVAAACVAGVLFGGSAGASVAPAVSDRVIVVFKPGVAGGERAAARRAAHTDLLRGLGRARFELVTPAPGQSVASVIAVLERDPSVSSAVQDGYLSLQSVPNDPRFGELWGLQNTGQHVDDPDGFFPGAPVPGADIDAPLAWDRTLGSPAVVVADLDTGYRFDHPDLAPVAWTNPGEIAGDGLDNDHNGYVDDTRGWDAIEADNNPTDPGWVPLTSADGPIPGTKDYRVSHGVHTAGTIAAKGNNGIGVTGVAQDVRIMPVRVCTSDKVCTVSAMVEGINYAGRNGARVANMSISTPPNAPAAVAVTIAQAFAANPGVLYVVAAGNDGADTDAPGGRVLPCSVDPSRSSATIGYTPPAGAVDNVVCVAATDRADGLASFSNFGAKSVDLAAPGILTLSTGFATDSLYRPNFAAGGFDDWTTPVPPASDLDQGFAHPASFPDFIWTDPPPFTGLPQTQAPDTTRATQTPAIPVDAVYATCTLDYTLFGSAAGDDRFSLALLVGGQTVLDRGEQPLGNGNGETGPPPSYVTSGEFDVPATVSPRTVTAQFRFARGESGADHAWVAVQSVNLSCIRPTYEYLSGTSMATPHVSGTAALLFSLNPQATVTQVKQALLKGVDKLPVLTKKTVTGGRLNAWKALEVLLPLDTRVTSGPSGSTKSHSATFTFDSNGSGPSTFECRLDGGSFQPCASPTSYTGLTAGKHSLRVRSALPGGVDTTPAIRDWTVSGGN
jgi:thermitase